MVVVERVGESTASNVLIASAVRLTFSGDATGLFKGESGLFFRVTARELLELMVNLSSRGPILLSVFARPSVCRTLEVAVDLRALYSLRLTSDEADLGIVLGGGIDDLEIELGRFGVEMR